jgi:hypothetical protein
LPAAGKSNPKRIGWAGETPVHEEGVTEGSVLGWAHLRSGALGAQGDSKREDPETGYDTAEVSKPAVSVCHVLASS